MADIRLRGVTKKFGPSSVAVNDLNLDIADASFTTLLGPSGCGKTTTLRMIAGLESPTVGEITIGSQIVFSSSTGVMVPPGRRRLGLVFQSYALWPHLSVFDNMAFGLQVQRVPSKKA